jgi:ribonuclease G
VIEDILVSVSPGETRVACLDRGRAVELHRFLHGRPTISGNVYLGRITRMVPGLGAAFVEIGAAKAGFLPLPSEADSRQAIHEGARVVVQVTREPERDKGAQLSTTVRIPGRLLVFAPRGDGVHVARRIGEETEGERLRAAISAFARPGEGWIARTNAVGAGSDELAQEAGTLRELWAGIAVAAAGEAEYVLVHVAPPPIVRVLRDKAGYSLRRLVVDDRRAYAAAEAFLRLYLPSAQAALAYEEGPMPLFEREGVEAEFEAIQHRRVPLPSGGSLIIERTEALWAIDVNTGRNISGSSASATILATNMEAAREIARQIRLRDLAGLLVLDFVHMEHEASRQQVLECLKAALAEDSSPVRLSGFSELGLVEISRRRTKPSLADEFSALCPACEGGGTIPAPIVTALAALRAALSQARARGMAVVRIVAAPAVAESFTTPEGTAAREELSAQLGRPVDIIADSTLAPDRFKLG